MTAAILEAPYTAEEAAQRFAARYRDAIREYLMGLSKLVEFESIELLEEDEDFDFQIRVPEADLVQVQERLADLSLAMSEKYGVRIATLAVPA